MMKGHFVYIFFFVDKKQTAVQNVFILQFKCTNTIFFFTIK